MISVVYKTLEARRFGIVNQPVNINNNSTLTNVSSEGDTLTIGFVFSSNYEPNVGVIRIEGDMNLKESKETIEKVVKAWKDSQQKNIPMEIAEKIHNGILANCIIEASFMARDINLPAPLPAPHINVASKESTQTKVDTQSYIR